MVLVESCVYSVQRFLRASTHYQLKSLSLTPWCSKCLASRGHVQVIFKEWDRSKAGSPLAMSAGGSNDAQVL